MSLLQNRLLPEYSEAPLIAECIIFPSHLTVMFDEVLRWIFFVSRKMSKGMSGNNAFKERLCTWRFEIW